MQTTHLLDSSVFLIDSHLSASETWIINMRSKFREVTVLSYDQRLIQTLETSLRTAVCPIVVLVSTEERDDEGFLLLHTLDQWRNDIGASILPIAWSACDTSSFMTECLYNGSVDFILKPFGKDSMKTLMLNIIRYQKQKHAQERDQRSSMSHHSTIIESKYSNRWNGKVWKSFEKRLKDVFLVDHWLSSSVTSYILPESESYPILALTREKQQQLKAFVCSWGFITLELSKRELVECAFLIIKQAMEHPDLASLHIIDDDLYHFIATVCHSYHTENSYHNFRHAVDVLQSTYFFLCRIGCILPMNQSYESPTKKTTVKTVKDLLRPIDIFALLMAAIGHDIGHPGVNNMFMIKTSTPLAILYNDSSVLENFHSMAFCHILLQHGFSQLVDCRKYPQTAVPFRTVIMSSILATDMAKHDEYVEKLEKQARRIADNAIDFHNELQCEEERLLLCGGLMKCADICNCARPFSSAEAWAKVLSEEFFCQGDLEQELGLTVLPINERGKLRLEDCQLFFKRNIAYKLFNVIQEVIPEMAFTVEGIEDNIRQWEDRKQRSPDVRGGDGCLESKQDTSPLIPPVSSVEAVKALHDISLLSDNDTFQNTPYRLNQVSNAFDAPQDKSSQWSSPSSTEQSNWDNPGMCRCVLQ